MHRNLEQAPTWLLVVVVGHRGVQCLHRACQQAGGQGGGALAARRHHQRDAAGKGQTGSKADEQATW